MRFPVTPPPAGRNVKVSVSGQEVEPSFNELGVAKLNVNGKSGDSVPVEIFVDGQQIDSNYRVLGAYIEVEWTRQFRTP
jgi:hypothetical protein